MEIKKAIILAGGLGTRLRPLTYNIPKSMIDINGKTLTEHVFDILKKFGIREIILSINYMANKIQDYFQDGSKFDIKINYVIEKEPTGTAGPLILMKPLEETFILINGDKLFDLNLNKMFNFHKKNKASATIALTKIEDPSKSGVVILKNNKIINFIEKPKNFISNIISSGYYILEPEVFNLVKGKKFAMIEKDIFPQLAQQGKLFGYIDNGLWFDTGTFENLEKVRKKWKLNLA